jgi:hypothetical protein
MCVINVYKTPNAFVLYYRYMATGMKYLDHLHQHTSLQSDLPLPTLRRLATRRLIFTIPDLQT